MNTVKIINTSADKPSADITERVKTFEDACNELGIAKGEGLEINCTSTAALPFLGNLSGMAKLMIITAALNQGWTPDWKNSSEYKYYPWFYMDHQTSGFSFGGVGRYCAGSCAGSRLCFKSRALAEYAAKQFTDIYKEAFSIT